MFRSLLDKSLSLLYYVSDLHLERGFIRNINSNKPFLLLGGDIGYPSTLQYKNFLLDTSSNFDKVFVLSGNHEYDHYSVEKTDYEIKNICNMRNNLFFLQKETHTLCEKDNIIIAGCTLWSKLPKTKINYHLEHVNWLRETIKIKNNNYIIGTHHCPLFNCIFSHPNAFKTSNYFVSDQSSLLKNNNIICWIHGHSHINKDFIFEGKAILSNQYGYSKEPLKYFKL
jgi:hypothetical protein